MAAARMEQDRAPVLVTVFVIGRPRMRQVAVGDDVNRDLEGFAGEGSGHRAEQEGGDPDGRLHLPIIVGGVFAVKWRRLEGVPGCGGGAKRRKHAAGEQYTAGAPPRSAADASPRVPMNCPAKDSRWAKFTFASGPAKTREAKSTTAAMPDWNARARRS